MAKPAMGDVRAGPDAMVEILQAATRVLAGVALRILEHLAPADRESTTRSLRLLVEAAGEGYGSVRHRLVLL